jgi:hypothetical protein
MRGSHDWTTHAADAAAAHGAASSDDDRPTARLARALCVLVPDAFQRARVAAQLFTPPRAVLVSWKDQPLRAEALAARGRDGGPEAAAAAADTVRRAMTVLGKLSVSALGVDPPVEGLLQWVRDLRHAMQQGLYVHGYGWAEEAAGGATLEAATWWAWCEDLAGRAGGMWFGGPAVAHGPAPTPEPP